MAVPTEQPGEDELDDLYALAEDASAQKNNATVEIRCPSCQSTMEPGAQICTNCGFNVKTGRRASAAVAEPAMAMAGGGGAAVASTILAYGGGNAVAKTAGKDEVGDNNLVEYYIPSGLIVFGLIVAMVQTMHFTSNPVAFGAAMGTVMVTTIVDLVLMLVACLIAAKVLDASFGSPGSAVLKLAGISLAPEAVASTIEYLTPAGYGWIVGWIVAILLYYALFSYLFDLDGGEVIVLVLIIRGVKFFIGGFIILALLALFMSGRGGGLAKTLANASSGGASNANSVADTDAEIEETLANTKWCAEAKGWLNDSSNRIFGKEPHTDCAKMVAEIYACGAKEVVAVKEGGVAEEVVIRLPKAKETGGAEKRRQIFAWYEKKKDLYDWEDVSDEGQKYLTLDFDPSVSAAERAKYKEKMKASGASGKKTAAAEDEEQ
jgi:hypothetical protein